MNFFICGPPQRERRRRSKGEPFPILSWKGANPVTLERPTCTSYQCSAVLRMRDKYLPIINPYPFTPLSLKIFLKKLVSAYNRGFPKKENSEN
jgi:hypothetical protein